MYVIVCGIISLDNSVLLLFIDIATTNHQWSIAACLQNVKLQSIRVSKITYFKYLSIWVYTVRNNKTDARYFAIYHDEAFLVLTF